MDFNLFFAFLDILGQNNYFKKNFNFFNESVMCNSSYSWYNANFSILLFQLLKCVIIGSQTYSRVLFQTGMAWLIGYTNHSRHLVHMLLTTGCPETCMIWQLLYFLNSTGNPWLILVKADIRPHCYELLAIVGLPRASSGRKWFHHTMNTCTQTDRQTDTGDR